jgi:hypothetical protein
VRQLAGRRAWLSDGPACPAFPERELTERSTGLETGSRPIAFSPRGRWL